MCKQCILAGVVIAAVVVVMIMAFSSQSQTSSSLPGKAEGADCSAHSECASGVCDFYKQDMGKCAAIECETGDEVISINGKVEYACNNSKWVTIIDGGQTCKDNPYCDLSNPCGAELTRVLQKDQFSITEDGRCVESMAQRVLPTVCAPCGNGMCDDVESKCNCPEDCPSSNCSFPSCTKKSVCESDSNCTYAWFAGGCYNSYYLGKCMQEMVACGLYQGEAPPREGVECTCINSKCAEKAAASGSGITGIIMLGPTCPVQREGETCERPFVATVVVKSAGSEVTRFTSGEDGRFTVLLSPGTYDLEPLTEGGAMLPRGESQTVTVQAGFTNVTISYDTGIR